MQEIKTAEFQFPNIYLDIDKEWKIRLLAFTGILVNPLQVDTMLEISTDVISRTVGNPRQVLGVMTFPAATTVVNYFPANSASYIIRFDEINSSVIKIFSDRKEPEKFRDAFIQLEIISEF